MATGAIGEKKPPKPYDAREKLAKLVKPALTLYARALRGEKISVAAQKAAENVLRAAGLLKENTAAAAPTNIIVDFLPVKSIDVGNGCVEPDDTACSTTHGDVPTEPGSDRGGSGD